MSIQSMQPVRRLFIELPQLAFQLSGKSVLKALLLTLKLQYFSVSRKFSLKNKPLSFKFIYNDKKFELELFNNLDLAVLAEIYVLNEYEWRPPFEIKSILDLGAHWGDTAVFYAVTYPKTNIFSFEPMPESFARLQKVASQFENVTCHNFAISEHTGVAQLYFSENSVGNSLQEREQSQCTVEIQTLSPGDVLELCEVERFDLVKFDVEGAETHLFNYPELQNMARAFVGEIHLDMIDFTLEQIEEKFAGFKVHFEVLKKNRYIMTAVKTN